MGRTGRKRVGKVIILVSEGPEEEKLKKSVSTANNITRVLKSSKNRFHFSFGPRMVYHVNVHDIELSQP